MTERRFKPVATTRIAALATSTSSLKRHGSVAFLLLFLLAAMTNAHAAAVTTTTALKIGLQASPGTAITTEPWGTNVTLTATITGTGASGNGTVAFTYGSTPTTITGCSAAPVSSGTATCTTTTLPVATNNTLKAAFTATNTSNFTNSSTAAATAFAVTQITTSTALKIGLQASPNTGITTEPYGTSVTLTATVTGTGAAGTVAFTYATSTSITGCSAVALSSGTATCTTSALPVAANNTLKAAFNPTTPADFTATSSTATAFAVTAVTATNTLTAALASAPTSNITSASPGASLILTATISPSAAAGTVSFKNGSTVLGAGTAGGTAGTWTYATSALTTIGTDALTAVFTPTTAGDFSAATTTGSLTFTVSKPIPTTTLKIGLTSSPNVSIAGATESYGSSVTLTATVTVSGTAATGTPTFYDNGVSIGTGSSLNSGSSTLTVPAPIVGNHPITVTYPGDSNYQTSSTASATSFTIAAVTTTTSIAVSGPATKTFNGPSFTLTATVTPSTVSQGSVTFYDLGSASAPIANATVLGTKQNVSGGTASVTIPGNTLAAGKHYLVASYGGYFASTGVAQYSTSLSVSAPVTVNGATVLTITASSNTAGSSVAYGAAVPTVTPSYSGFANGDTSANLATKPTCTTTYTITTPPGTYPVANTCSGAVDTNYTIGYTAGSLTVIQATATISHWYNQSTVYGTPITLSATTNSTGALSYALVSGPATLSTLSGVTTLTPTGAGAVVISASVAGNTDFTAAGPTQVTITVNQAPLVVTASSPSTLAVGGTVPTISVASYATFVHSDTSASLTHAPTCTTNYKANSAPGSYTTSCSGAVDANYSITYVPGSFNVTLAAQTIKGFYATSTTYGTPVAFTATSTSGLPLTYTVTSGPGTIPPGGTTMTPSGPGTVAITASQTGNGSYAAATPVPVNVTVYQAPLVITASSPSTIALGGTVPTITATYVTGNANFVNGDTNASLATAPTCTTNYKANSAPGPYTTSCSGAVDPKYSITYAPGGFTVTKGAQTIKGFYNSTTLNGTALTFTATATSALGVIYTVASGPGSIGGSILTPTGPGTVVVNANQPGNASYAAAPQVTINVVVYQYPLVITASSPSAIVYGQAAPTPTPSYSGWMNGDGPGSLTAPPTCFTPTYTTTSAPGSYPTVCYGAVDPKYSISYVSGSLIVNKAPAVITTPPTASVAFTYGQTLGTNTNLNVSGVSTNVPGIFTWTSPTSIPKVSVTSANATFTPTSSTDYTTVTTIPVTITVNVAVPTINTPPSASATTYGSTLATSNLSGGTTNAIGGGTFKWTCVVAVNCTALSTIGANAGVGVTFIPNDTADYTSTATASIAVTVNKATPVIVWPTASSIVYGQPLSASNFSGQSVGAPVVGTFAWANPSAVPAAGTSSATVNFTPASSPINYAADYSTATHTVSVTVTPKVAVVNTWPTATAITYPQTLASSTLVGGSATTPGHFMWNNSSTQPNAGSAVAEDVTFVPNLTTEFSNNTAGSVNVLVNQGATTVSGWPTASPITLPGTLANSILDQASGSASQDGTFVWTDTTITPAAGTSSYAVTFNPSNTSYASVNNGSVPITVNPCGLQDTGNAAFSTSLEVYVATGSVSSLTNPADVLDAEGANVSAICAATGVPGDGTGVTVTYPSITSNAGNSNNADSSSNGTNAAVLAYGTNNTVGAGATITINDDGAGDPSSISTAGNYSSAVFASKGGTVNITDANINTYGTYSYGLDATYGGTLTLNDVMATTSNNNSAAIMSGTGGANVVTSTGGTYTTNGTNAAGVYAAGNGSTVTLSGDTVTAKSWTAVVVEGGNTVTIGGGTSLTGSSGNNHGIFFFEGSTGDATAGTGTFTMTDGSITYNCDASADGGVGPCATGTTTLNQNALATVFAVANTTATISLIDVAVTNGTNSTNNGILLTVAALNSGTLGSNGGNVTFNAAGETLAGDVIVDAISTATLSLGTDGSSVGSSLNGAINNANSGAATVSLTLDANSTWIVTGNSYLTYLNNAVAGNGNITCGTPGCQVFVNGVAQTGIN